MTNRCLAWAFLLIFGCNFVKSIDFTSEKDYDSELEDELDEIQDIEDHDAAAEDASLGLDTSGRDQAAGDLQELLRSRRDLEEGVFEDEEEEEEDEMEDLLAEDFYEGIERRGLKMRILNLLRNFMKKHGIEKTHSTNGTCDAFRGSFHMTHKCKTIQTDLGAVITCRVRCRSGYHLKRPIPHYELCGAATKWRWTYQLRGYSRAEEICVKDKCIWCANNAKCSSANALRVCPDRLHQGSAKKSLPTSCTDPYCVASAAYYMNKIDYSVNPCDDFFEYSCGKWLKETPIPAASQGRYLTYSIIRRRVKKDVAKLLEKRVAKTDIASVKKAKITYQSCMNTDLIEKLDAKPLLDMLKGDMAWPVINKAWTSSKFDLESTLAALRGHYHNNVLFKVRVGKNVGNYILQTWKGKTALPYQYYILPRYSRRRDAYFELMKDTAIMLGADKATAYNDMKKVLAFETEISLHKVLDKDYWSQITLGQMKNDIPGIDWLKLFRRMARPVAVNSNTPIQVWNAQYLRDLVRIIKRTDKRTVQNYMVWRIVKHRIKNLSRRFQLRYLKYENAMVGKRELHKRWYSCTLHLIFAMKGPTGKMFVDAHFSPAKKATAEEMFNNIRNAFIHLLDTEVDWMDKKTKAYAKVKAKFMKPHVGYNAHIYENTTYLNNHWKKMVAKKGDYFGNILRILTQISQNEFKKLTESYKTSFRGTSTTRPTMVNAFYTPSHNTITLPAGEMQYPFYWGDKFPKMFQYGAIGTILGHEITHGFDNHGALRDKYGRSRNWWSQKSLKEFHKRTTCMANQYSNYYWKVAGENLNGWKTLGENIADNGGIRESYYGYRTWLKSQNLTAEDIEPATGLTNDQMFFVGFANVRCAKHTHKEAEHYGVTSVHSPGRFRVIGSLQNFDKFSEAFHCPKNSYMNPSKKCVIW